MSAPWWSLWLCADCATTEPDELVARVGAVLARRPACVWLRAPRTMHARPLLGVARRLARAVRANGGALVVGDRVDVALVANANGVHLSRQSVAASDARSVARSVGCDPFIVSAAVHDEAAIRATWPDTDALVLSPFGAVPGKGAALGVGGFAALRAVAPARRFVALGGIDRASVAREAALAGADAIAVRRALFEGRDPADACDALAAAFDRAREALSR